MEHRTHRATEFSRKREFAPPRPSPRIALAIILALLSFQPLALGQQSPTEDQVKAAYLFNFAKVGEWPQSALPDGPSSFVIGVSGADDDFLDVLNAVVSGKVIATRPVVITRVNSEEDARIIFFRSPEKKRALTDVEGLAQPGLLLVGENDSFLRQGGMVNLVRQHGSIHFEINPEALDGSQIRFSAKILALGKAGLRVCQHRGHKQPCARQTAGRAHRSPPLPRDCGAQAVDWNRAGVGPGETRWNRQRSEGPGPPPSPRRGLGTRRQAVEVPARSKGNGRGRKVQFRPEVNVAAALPQRKKAPEGSGATRNSRDAV